VNIYIEMAGKIVGLLCAIYPIGKGIIEWVYGRTSRMREEYRFAKEFLSAINGQVPVHSFALEKGYQALAGSKRITISEAQYLLSLENSASRMEDFVLGYAYIQHLVAGGGNEISFRTKFVTDFSRLWRKIVYFFGYVVWFFAAFSPFIFAGPLRLSPSVVLVSLALTLPTLGAYAVFSLTAAFKLMSAERLIKLQRRMPAGSEQESKKD
jgi:hypothetical protein